METLRMRSFELHSAVCRHRWLFVVTRERCFALAENCLVARIQIREAWFSRFFPAATAAAHDGCRPFVQSLGG